MKKCPYLFAVCMGLIAVTLASLSLLLVEHWKSGRTAELRETTAASLTTGTARTTASSRAATAGRTTALAEEPTEATSPPLPPATPGEAGLEVRITSRKATELARAAMDDSSPIRDVTLTFSPGVIRAEGVAQRDLIFNDALIRRYPWLIAVRALLPSRANVAVSFGAAVEESHIVLQPRAFALGGQELPIDILPESVQESIGQVLTQYLVPQGLEVTGVTVGEGILTVTAD